VFELRKHYYAVQVEIFQEEYPYHCQVYKTKADYMSDRPTISVCGDDCEDATYKALEESKVETSV